MISFDDIAGTAKAGTLYGIGVGPGDARYLTLRAAGLVRSVDVLAYFAKKGRQGNARKIVSPLVDGGRRELKLVYPVTDEIPADHPDYRAEIGAFYAEAAALIEQELRGGNSVGLLAEGDPFFYGSFMHLYIRLRQAGQVPVHVLPGIPGMVGCWHATGVPMTWGDDVMTVLPATLPDERLRAHVAGAEALVFMKVGRHLPRIRAVLQAAGKLDQSWLVINGTMADEQVMPLREAPERCPYFAIVIVHGQGRRPANDLQAAGSLVALDL